MVLVNMFAVGWIPYDNNANDLFPSRLRFQEALSSNLKMLIMHQKEYY